MHFGFIKPEYNSQYAYICNARNEDQSNLTKNEKTNTILSDWDQHVDMPTIAAMAREAQPGLLNLVEIVAKGGSLLLGIGPKPDGTLDPEAVMLMKQIGGWLNENGKAIYDTRITPAYNHGEVFFTSGKIRFT